MMITHPIELDLIPDRRLADMMRADHTLQIRSDTRPATDIHTLACEYGLPPNTVRHTLWRHRIDPTPVYGLLLDGRDVTLHTFSLDIHGVGDGFRYNRSGPLGDDRECGTALLYVNRIDRVIMELRPDAYPLA